MWAVATMTTTGRARADSYLRIGLGGAAIVAAVLGFIGFEDLIPRPGLEAGEGWTDIAYYTLQLFLLDAAPLQTMGDLPVVLDIARFLAPATTLLTLGYSVKAVYDSTYDAVRARRLDAHTIVCGDGAPALLVARGVAREGRTCVVISPGTASSDPAPDLRDETVLRVGGDPRDVDVLREARIDRAREVIVVTGDSARNTDVAAAVRTALDGVDTPPPCFLEMASPELASALAAYELNSGSPVHVEFFDPVTRAARRLLDAHLPAPEDGSLVLVGAGETFEAIREDLRRRDRTSEPAVAWTSTSPSGLVEFEIPENMVRVVVAVDDDVQAVQLGLRLLQRLRDVPVDVVVATRSSTALGSTITGQHVAGSSFGRARLNLFNTTDHVYDLSSLRDGVYRDMARVAHTAYVTAARKRGESAHDNASTVPWAQLTDDLQRANIDQARGIGAKLRAEHLAVVPASETDTEFTFEGAELERLAVQEHDRWCADKKKAGWQKGPRDDEAMTHPDLVPWTELSPESKQKDRDSVRAMPDQLRQVGLHVLRVSR
ncbi:RyR domain-containing protein [Actinomycetospora termitidis]|uniref:RyR domain-containing protein n=1 Tax=Actinomycetospora termitidis TaxID=3053470 RepID=A0ABT7MEG4_9PSEU|nr:RyR domain-containing protein [Actinomycetospora sp. Odt1-22]MDL5159049.1 RyR domain-containing protein [Actinomycetospora sp. Odt1-22]